MAMSQGTKQTHTNNGYGLEGNDKIYKIADRPVAIMPTNRRKNFTLIIINRS
jgi:hypothetical protein